MYLYASFGWESITERIANFYGAILDIIDVLCSLQSILGIGCSSCGICGRLSD